MRRNCGGIFFFEEEGGFVTANELFHRQDAVVSREGWWESVPDRRFPGSFYYRHRYWNSPSDDRQLEDDVYDSE